jgi:hypothetical protein
MTEPSRWQRVIDALGQTWPAQAAKDAINGLKLPGDVYAGRVDPMSDEAIGRAFDLTGTLASQAPVAAQAGAFGIFGGRMAKTAPRDKLAEFERLEAIPGAKTSMDAQQGRWARTGWFRGVDEQPKFEIPDKPAALKQDLIDNMRAHAAAEAEEFGAGSATGIMTMRDVLDHAELYKAYPHLENLPVVISDAALPMDGIRGAYMKPGQGTMFPDTGHIEVHGGLDPKQMRSTLLHEIQHAVQQHEGFAPGANAKTVGAENYRRSAGEVEARTVQHRKDMDEWSRKFYHPARGDVPASQQIISRPSPVVNRPQTARVPFGLLGPRT